jgi:phosphoribosylglycinamide formyltransferase-1
MKVKRKATRIGVLVSGRGSNLQAIIDAIGDGSLDAQVTVVISDHAEAFALERARHNGIEAIFQDPKAYPGKEAYDAALVEALTAFGVDLICLAGFMRIVTPVLIRAFPLRIMNIHPALLPAFPGLHVQLKALEHGVRFSGCTVHFVDEGVDTGPVIIQAVVPVLPDDSEGTLSARILR